MRLRTLLQAAVIIVVAVAAIVFLILLPDLFFAIPWSVRKAVGWVGVFSLGGVGVRWLLGPGVSWDFRGSSTAASQRAHWTTWVLLGLVALLAVPLLRHPANLGFGDWDLFLGKLEAARRTILLWGQFPWWDPWSRGGFPLAANPQCGVIGVAMPLSLAFGTSVGMRLATIVCFLLAAEGARRLARLWLEDPFAAACAGLIYAVNGGVLVAAVAAYHVSMCYSALPWMLYHIFQLERKPTAGLWIGFWTAFLLLNGIQYFTVYTMLIAGVVWIRALRTRKGRDRRRLLVHTVLALGTFLTLAGWRLATTGLVYRDFPRPYSTLFSESPWSMLGHLLNRPSASALAGTDVPYFWETTCYIGPVVLLLFAASLTMGWRWWHTLAFVCGWLGAGSWGWYYPSYWLSHFPVFATMHVVTRWRFMAMLGVALGVADVIATWRRSDRRVLRQLAYCALASITLDYLAYGFEVLPVAFSVAPSEDRFPGAPLPRNQIIQAQAGLGFPAIQRGYGLIQGVEPLMGYNKEAPTARLWLGAPDYRGEHWTERGTIQPRFWSPNRIEIEVEPDELVFINQNPGSWWRVNGQHPFAESRCAEKDQTFAVRADNQGRLLLEIQPRGLWLGFGLHLTGFVLVVGTWIVIRRGRKGNEGNHAG
jgi:hypothetical protein